MGNKPAPNGQNKSPSGVWVDIFRTGNHTDSSGQEVTITGDDLDQLVSSFTEIGDAFKPPLRLGGHDSGVAPAVGWIGALRRDGNHLKALFTDVAPVVGQAINKGLYRNVSAGLRFSFKHGEKTLKVVLHHVAILGHAIPAIKGLEGLPALFEDEDGDVITVEFKEKESDVDLKEALTRNAELEVENKGLTKQLQAKDATFSEAETGHTTALADQKAEHDKAMKVKDDELAKFATKQAESDVDAVMLAAGKEGRLNPKTKDAVRRSGLAARQQANFSEEKSPFADWKDTVENSPKVVDFEEKAHTNPGGDNEKETKAEADFAAAESDVAKVMGYGKK